MKIASFTRGTFTSWGRLESECIIPVQESVRARFPTLGAALRHGCVCPAGELRQSASLSELIFDVNYLISYVSGFTPLIPGNLILTGTPQGVGFSRKPPLWLKPGDVVEVMSPDIGTLRNTVLAEADLAYVSS
ncbi:MAG TPA: fumarylacetoacetate hydrolase family protein [Steroidobacteraceae bacterium]|jgi:hypothetical protein